MKHEESDQPKRPFSLFRFLLKFLLGFLGSIVAIALVMALISVLVRRDPYDVLPAEFDIYARVDSASDFFENTVDLAAADVLLSSPDLAPVRQIVATVRNQDLLRSRLFRFLADIRLDAALYPDQSFVAVADLGVRSAVTRLGRLLAPYLSVDNLSYVSSGAGSHFVYGEEGSALYIRLDRNLVIVTRSLETLTLVGAMTDSGIDEELVERLDEPSGYQVRLLLRPASFLDELREIDTPAGRILSDLEFTQLALVGATIANDRIDIAVDLPIESANEEVQRLLAVRSGAPTVVSVFPEETYYYSLASGLELSALRDTATAYLDDDTVSALNRADSAARTAVGLGLDELVFSWTGDEAGVFGLDSHPEPVFFVSIADETRRREVFEQVLSTMLLAGDESQSVQGVRVPQLVLPRFLRFLLRAFDVTIPEPYYIVENGFFLLSESPEALALVVRANQSQELLAGSLRWEQTGAQVPAAATISVLFSLDQTTPAFLRGDGPAFEALRLYQNGIANIRLDGDRLGISLAAVPGAGGGIVFFPGFPIEAEARLSSGVEVLEGADGITRLYWMERDRNLVEFTPSTGERALARIGDASWILPSPDAEEPSIWLVTDRGAVYRFGPGLRPSGDFPIVTGERPSAPPLLAERQLVLPVRDEPGLLVVSEAGKSERIAIELDDPFLATPDYHQGLFVGYPKSFLAGVERFTIDGERSAGWPAPLSGIAFGSPVIIPRPGGSHWTAFVTQAGEVTVWDELGAPRPGFPIELDGVFYSSMVWSTSASSLYLVSEAGRIFRVGLDGQSDSATIRGLSGQESSLEIAQADGRGPEEVFIYGAGNIVFGFASDLRPLEGFPVAGGRRPVFADLNGDEKPELITGGFNDTIYVYAFR
ncbi:MAG: hypothetical protein ACLFNT_08645 [Spirochaetales bacterium]